MIRLMLLCVLGFPLQGFSQRADSTVATIYIRLIEELAKDFPVSSENVFVMNDLYYPAWKETPAAYDTNLDTLVYSSKFRELISLNLGSVTKDARTQFAPLPQYNAVFAEFNYEFTGPHKGKKMQFFYIEKPVDNRDYYDLSFNGRKEFVIHMPVQLFESNGTSYKSRVDIYRISGDAKGKLTVKKL